MSKKILVVSSFSEVGYEQYGKDFLESFISYWPLGKDVDLRVYHHSRFPRDKAFIPWVPKDLPVHPNVTYKNLDDFDEVLQVKEVFVKGAVKRIPKQFERIVPWEYDVPKFVNKVFAIAEAVVSEGSKYDWLVWLDADTQTFKDVPKEFLDELLDDTADVIRMARPQATSYSETSFVAYNLKKAPKKSKAVGLIDAIMFQYLSGEYVFHQEWHDGFIFERLLNVAIVSNSLKAKNITPNATTLDAFGVSPLAAFMRHDKGNKKKDGGMASTATQLQTAITKGSNNPFVPQGGALKQVHPGAAPFVVTPVDCVADESLTNNILENINLINEWVTFGKKVKGSEVIVASAGPSLEKFIPEIKERVAKGAKLACVKHSLPRLIATGVIPNFCVVLDPRELEGVSTTGKVRKDLFSSVTPEMDINFLVASMTNPNVTKYLISKGLKVFGWHAACGELIELIKDKKIPPSKSASNDGSFDLITIGTCSAIRGIGLLDSLGFQKLTLTGFDSSLVPQEDTATAVTDSNLRKYFHAWLPKGLDYQIQVAGDNLPEGAHPIGGRFFWSTGEFVALYQDFMGIIPELVKRGVDEDRIIECLTDEDTLIGEGWRRYQQTLTNAKNERDKLQKKRDSLQTYKDIFKMV